MHKKTGITTSDECNIKNEVSEREKYCAMNERIQREIGRRRTYGQNVKRSFPNRIQCICIYRTAIRERLVHLCDLVIFAHQRQLWINYIHSCLLTAYLYKFYHLIDQWKSDSQRFSVQSPTVHYLELQNNKKNRRFSVNGKIMRQIIFVRNWIHF